MKKVSNFVINKRFYIFAILMVLFVGAIFLIPKVVINKDMTKYLPDDSSMKAGITIIDKEFPGTLDQKDIKVMFKDLADDDIPNVLNTLKGIKNVTTVTYDSSDNYNKGEYTLFVLSSDYSYKTPEEKQIEKDVKKTFNDYNVVVQHVMYATTTIPTWVLIVAFTALTIILFIMCSSWIDPILFLFTIGVAVVLNFGTNFFLKSVSESTFSLSAILQLVLSMDYSIILMNRYRQEKEEHNLSPKDAMKNAFASATPSILGSGLTTIVGLLMLIFMDFKLGMDLGIVMAKGAALSMICVFTILPTLIIWSDKLIYKFDKKPLNISMRHVARFEYHHRYTILIVFILLFFGSFFFQGNTKITFAEVKNDKIGEVFTPTNNAIIVYDNEEEDKINDLVDKISKDKDVNMVLSYANTLALPMKANEMNNTIKQMAGDFKISDKIVKMLYYDYYKKDEALPNLTIKELYDTIANDVLEDEMIGELITPEIKDKILSFKDFTDKDYLEKKRTAKEVANIIGIEEDKLGLLYSVYYTVMETYVPKQQTLAEFVKFINDKILTNPLIKDKIPAEALAQFTMLEKYSNKVFITTPMNPNELSSVTNMPVELINNIFLYKFGSTDNKLSLHEFVNYCLSDIVNNSLFASYFPLEVVNQLKQLQKIMNITISEKKLTFTEMSNIVVIDNNAIINQMMVKAFYIYHDYLENPDNFKVSLVNLVNFTTTVLFQLPMFSDLIPLEQQEMIKLASTIMTGIVKETKYNPVEITEIINKIDNRINRNVVEIIYLLNASINNSDEDWTLSLEQAVNYLDTVIIEDERFAPFITEEIKLAVHGIHKMLKDNKRRMVGSEHSLIVLDLKVPEESPATTEFFNRLDELCKNSLSRDYHFVGEAAMNVEMEAGFDRDLWLITILTAVAIFVIVAITFRSLLIPLVLVLIVQCGVFMTVCISGILSHGIYYLALLIVQCILMGATIDYGIVFTNYYKDNRKTLGIGPSIDLAYDKSLHTIMTSGMIIVLVTGLIGLSPADPAIGQICLTLSFGTLCAILLILFALPGLISIFDKYIIRKKRVRKVKTKEKEEVQE